VLAGSWIGHRRCLREDWPLSPGLRRARLYQVAFGLWGRSASAAPLGAPVILEERLRQQEAEGVEMPEGMARDELALRILVAVQSVWQSARLSHRDVRDGGKTPRERPLLMKESDVLAVLDAVDGAGAPVWVAGGWGIDALLSERTREHDDLDLAIRSEDQERIIPALQRLGYDPVEDDDWRPSRLGVANSAGRKIDLHLVVFDSSGRGIQANLPSLPPYEYPPEGFVQGRIGGRTVQCLSPSLQADLHRGYQWTHKDEHDMRHLSARFGIDAAQK
jgi:lincosamide nucleotidyltransferase A/C/D/E